MAIHIGGTNIDAVYVGANTADAVYVGDTKVWPLIPPDPTVYEIDLPVGGFINGDVYVPAGTYRVEFTPGTAWNPTHEWGDMWFEFEHPIWESAYDSSWTWIGVHDGGNISVAIGGGSGTMPITSAGKITITPV